MIGCDSFFYYPSRNTFYTPAVWALPYESVTFQARDGVMLDGWFIPARRPLQAPPDFRPKGTVIHFHGNAENMTSHIAFVHWFPDEGYNLLAFDYRGYGKSEGSVSRAGTILDGHAAVDYALSRPETAPGKLFIFAQSLGGAIATVVAAERPEVAAVVLDSTFSGYRRIAAAHLSKMMPAFMARAAAAGFVSDGYDPIDYVARISPRPLLIIAGSADEICYPELGRELFDAAREPREFWLIQGAAHTEAIDNLEHEAIRRITACFESAPTVGRE